MVVGSIVYQTAVLEVDSILLDYSFPPLYEFLRIDEISDYFSMLDCVPKSIRQCNFLMINMKNNLPVCLLSHIFKQRN